MLTKLPHIVPPRKQEIEQRVLSGICYLADPNDLRVQKAMLQLDEHCFCDLTLRQIYEILAKLFKDGQDMSLVNLLGILPNDLYLFAESSLREEYYTGNYLESDVHQLIALRALRKQIRIMTDAVNASLEALTPQESLDVIAEHLQKINRTTSTTRKSYLRTYETIADEFLSEPEEDTSQFTVDIPDLPAVPNRALITIAGRSGHGKTFWALYLMDKIIDAQPGKQTLYFNLEMHERVMMERHARLIGIKGYSRREVIANGVGQLLPKNVSLISEPMITIDEIETESRLAALRQPIAVIVVDYLGLIRSKSKSESKHLEQTDIAKRLAALSLELDCVVIALIQVNRDFKTRPVGDRCPVVQDSSDSMGSVHSSSWWLGIDQPQNDDDSDEWRDMFMVECRKNRGDSGLFKLRFTFKHGMFSKWQRPFSTGYKKSELDGF